MRQHEQAHQTAGGRYTRGGASFSYTSGPDGRRYATGGEVSIDMSSEKTPEATIAKMNTVRRAALAPMDPSPTDRAVAASAAQKAASARQEQVKKRMEKATQGSRPGRGDMAIGKKEETGEIAAESMTQPLDESAGKMSLPGVTKEASSTQGTKDAGGGLNATLKQPANKAYNGTISEPAPSRPTFRAVA